MFTSSGQKIFDQQLRLRGGVETLTPGADLQLDDQSGNFLRINGEGADRAIKMPMSNRDGVPIRITNVGPTNALNLQDSTGAPIAGATAALAVGEAAWVVNELGTWRHMGIETVVL